MDNLILIIALGAVAAGFVQGLSGFGFNLVALSFWAWAVDPKLAATLGIFGALTGQIIAAFSVRRGLQFQAVLPFIFGGLLGVPIGVGVLPHLDAHVFKIFLGTLLMLWCPAMLVSRNLPRITGGGRLGDGFSGLCGGVCGGIGGFSGAIPTLWCTLRGFEKDAQRSVIQDFNLATLAVAMAGHLLMGNITSEMLPMFAVVAPAMLIPTVFGTKLYIGMSEALFRKVVLSLLTASGAALFMSALPHVWREF